MPAPQTGLLHRPPLDRRDDLDDVAMSCVPFARAVSGIDVRGNAADWWENAAGSYPRGNRPEPGSVLSFQAIDRMPLGHVAVVTKILGKNRIAIDHANWDEAGTVARDVPVTDVSPNNDWTQVRVDAGRDGDFGSVYPTDGFIYNRAGAVPALSASAGERAPAARPVPGLPVVVTGPGGGAAFSLAGLWTGKLARPRVFTPRGLAAD